MQQQMELLRQISLFRDLTPDELARIWAIVIPRSYRKRTAIFTEGSHKEAVFFVQNGLIKTYKTDENGNEHIMSFLKTGDMFPHTGFFNQHPYPATAEAIMETQLLAIPIHAFEQLMMNTPAIAIKVMRVLSGKIIELQEKLQELTGQDVQDRGVSFLLKLAENYGTDHGGIVHVEVPMTNQEFANTIGTTRETVNRLINQLRKEGILEPQRSGYLIHDYEALKTWSHK
ncbi:Crp/Fnr family transcriptional regulator [Paenibacillus sp. Leaf72]|uniref:Crp/Fnr family transcriptional regulator n=1 Tax=Paenibacillus sp. Leaf72 TaxID=1736234 RepID=UPI0006F3D5F9|nr:Crp/Fnr family transcriptional regulator [Paenibacillus sp. Leaf72]KQO17290.1 Crp/Fnr family transcriptional regulator [Paenibacillus sp. Leaf72]